MEHGDSNEAWHWPLHPVDLCVEGAGGTGRYGAGQGSPHPADPHHQPHGCNFASWPLTSPRHPGNSSMPSSTSYRQMPLAPSSSPLAYFQPSWRTATPSRTATPLAYCYCYPLAYFLPPPPHHTSSHMHPTSPQQSSSCVTVCSQLCDCETQVNTVSSVTVTHSLSSQV